MLHRHLYVKQKKLYNKTKQLKERRMNQWLPLEQGRKGEQKRDEGLRNETAMCKIDK